MAASTTSRASVSDRRASVAMRQQARPATGNPEDGSRNRKMSTATETRGKSVEHAALLRRTKISIQPDNESKRSSYAESNGTATPSVARSQPTRNENGWHPTATLLSITSTNAPLACRVSVPPQAKHAPVTLQGTSLASLSLDKQEKVIIDDLLFVLFGLEGQYISFGMDREPYDPFDEQSRLGGPVFRIAQGLDPSLRDLAQQILRIATHVSALEAFIEVMSRQQYGRVSHAFCAALRTKHKEFLVLIAQLENQYLTKDGFSLQQMSLHLRKSAHSMNLLFSLTQEILRENALIGSPEDENSEEDEDDDYENVLAQIREGNSRSRKTCIGGALLVLLTRRLQALSGDPQAKELLSSLLKQASVPFIRMLNEWVHHGNVKDAHQEFMVKETKSIHRQQLDKDYLDKYWEQRYTIKQELVPPQLSVVADKALLAGKYLNVVRECSKGETFSMNFRKDLAKTDVIPHDLFDSNLVPSINAAYHHANGALMQLLLSTHHLAQRLKSLKHYFFLDRSDWFTYFLELAHTEMRKSAKNANHAKLQSLLDLVLHTPGSVAAEDPFKEDVRITITETALTGFLMSVVNVQGFEANASALSHSYIGTDQSSAPDDDMKVHQALMLDISIPFPLSLIVSRLALSRYQVIFRYLLSLRYLEHTLTTSWGEAGGIGSTARKSEAKSVPYQSLNVWRRRSGNARIEAWKRRAWCLRSRMLTFVQQMLYFCTAEVIDPNWKVFMGKLSAASSTETVKDGRISSNEQPSTPKRTVDQLMQDHVDFLASCLKECMLTNSKLIKINSKVITTCSHFAQYTGSVTRSLDRVMPANASKPSEEELNRLFHILAQYEAHFSRHLKILLDALNYLAATETTSFLNLCARLSMALEGGADGRPSPASLDGSGI